MRSRWGVPVATLALALFAGWRVRIGADVGDGTHVVALAMRMAQGDQVLADEMNLQALGSLAAVPFTWLWLHLVGVEGIVLASRVFYLVLAFSTGVVSYRALRTGLPAIAAFPAVVLMLLPTPYNLLVTSYNTMPVLALGLATCAAYAALTTRSSGWAAGAGVALLVAVLSHPSSLPAAAALALTLLALSRHRPVVIGVLAGGGTASLLVLLAITVGPGLSALQDTITYTAEYQAERAGPVARWDRAFRRYLDGLLAWRHLPAIMLACLALVPRLRWKWRALCVLGIPLALVVAAWTVVPPTIVNREPFGLLSGAFVLLAVTLMLLPVAVWAHGTAHHDSRLLILLTAPMALIGVISYSMVSSAGATWGVAAPPVQPLFGALGAGLVLWLARHGSTVLGTFAAVALVSSLAVVHPLRTFQNPDPRQLSGRIPAGPLAGLATDAHYLAADCQLRAAVSTWIEPGESAFFYARSGGYAYSQASMDTNIVWISDFGAANRWTVDWWDKTGRLPDVAFVYPAPVRAAGGWEELAAEDPLIARLSEGYGEPVELPGLLALRRDGTARELSGDPPVGCPPPSSSSSVQHVQQPVTQRQSDTTHPLDEVVDCGTRAVGGHARCAQSAGWSRG